MSANIITWNVKYKRPLQPRGSAFLFGAGFLEDFLRFPIVVESAIREIKGMKALGNGRATIVQHTIM